MSFQSITFMHCVEILWVQVLFKVGWEGWWWIWGRVQFITDTLGEWSIFLYNQNITGVRGLGSLFLLSPLYNSSRTHSLAHSLTHSRSNRCMRRYACTYIHTAIWDWTLERIKLWFSKVSREMLKCDNKLIGEQKIINIDLRIPRQYEGLFVLEHSARVRV